jgi:signal transduction histidine kinase
VIRRWLLAFLTVATAGPLGAVRAADTQKQVLVVYSTRRDTQVAVVGDRELPRILDAGLPTRVDFYSEYIDLARFPAESFETSFRDYLKLKYGGKHFDLVIAMMDNAFRFVGAHRDDLFPDTPVVFMSADREASRIVNSTGIVGEYDFAGSVSFAVRLQPDVTQVFVVSGNSARDKAYETLARAQFAAFEPRLSFTYLSGLRSSELEQRAADLPAHSILYSLLVYQDGAGQNGDPIEYLNRIAAVANRPSYSWVDSAIGHGIVGGSLISLEARAQALGAVALRVLRGEPADSIPIATASLNVPQVDWRQLRRWGISDARVPGGTRILFREPGAWERYRGYIITAMLIVFAQAALIAGLLVQLQRRRRAEVAMRGSEAQLRASYERIRDLGGRLLTAQEAERSRVARELHDDISQQIAFALIDLQMVGRTGGGGGGDDGEEPLLRRATDSVQSIAKSVRDLSHRLHPATLGLTGLVPAIRSLQQDLSTAQVAVTFVEEELPKKLLPNDVALALFRVVQEGVRNAVSYSGAREVVVRLAVAPEGLRLVISDNGCGFDLHARLGSGLGLISMRERLDAIGATLTIQTAPGQGTRLDIVLPEGGTQALAS